MKKLNNKTLIKGGQLADKLGFIQAAMAPLKLDEKETKKAICELVMEPASFNGKLYRATVSYAYPERYDLEKMKKYLTPRQLKSCLVPCTEPTISVRVFSLKAAANGKHKS
jgi:hypothetical protein